MNFENLKRFSFMGAQQDNQTRIIYNVIEELALRE